MTDAMPDAAETAVTRFEHQRREVMRQKRASAMVMAGIFVIAVLWSAQVSDFLPEKLINGVPRIFEYFGTIMPQLELDKLFIGREAAGDAVPGSITYWYADFWQYVSLIWDTLLMALTASMLGAIGAFLLCFPASRNLTPNYAVYWLARRVMEVLRGVPEILFALILVFMVGIGPLAGVIAIALHTVGALGKLFSEVNENASLRPVDGIAAVGGTWAERMMLGILPQVMPNFVSYALLRFEINVRSSAVIGFVGAGGIGQELNRVISFYSDDRVLAVLVLIVVTVTAIDLVSDRLRQRLTGKED
ncbi:phosphonate ABC transporter, permease protein PhnE [Roseovarius tibetensis]|uniref:phosphonate ABC transporter, permease protein PhnE n=1 Tax=Roseovarius tibetensis TaxID=2685897 RepID=UPI003D7F530A